VSQLQEESIDKSELHYLNEFGDDFFNRDRQVHHNLLSLNSPEVQITQRPLKDKKIQQGQEVAKETLGTGEKHDQVPTHVSSNSSDEISRPDSGRTIGDEPLGGKEAGDANHGTEEEAEQLPFSLKVRRDDRLSCQ
jgi:uncharacterized sporulation protein YeaH/YhbH (DUF444 family)